VAGLAASFGSGAMTNSIGEVKKADTIFVTGSNTTEAHPVIGSMMKKSAREGANLIVADPREIGLCKEADVAVQQKPGTDIALLNGLMNVIIANDWHDKDYIENRTENFAAVKEAVAEYTPEKVEEITGVKAEDIIEMAKLYAQADSAAIYYSMGMTQHKSGTDNVLTVANLAMLTGNVGIEGGGVNPLRGQNNVQGACDLGGLPNVYPGYQSVEDPEIKEKFEQAWDVDELNGESGLTVVEIVTAAGKGDVKGLYVLGENPMISDPDQTHVEKALKATEFLVVQDIFLTETAELADVVIPAACFAEKDGTFTNSERRLQMVNKAVDAPGEAKADWEVFCELAKRLGYDMDYDSAAEIMDEIAEVSPIYGGFSYERIANEELQWPCTDKDHQGTKFLHEGEFAHGKGKFHATKHIPPIESADDEYPYIMMTGRMLYHYHGGSMTRRSNAVDNHEPDAYLEISFADANKLGVEDGDRVKVNSRRGLVETNARITNKVKEGEVFMPFHYAESPANRLTNNELDPKSKIPELKVTAVNVEKA